MQTKEKSKIHLIDTSAILSGKPLYFENTIMMTTPLVSDEISPGGRDYQTFQYLLEKGLMIQQPSKKSIQIIKKTSQQTGDDARLSSADIELLALAYELSNEPEKEVILITDDYSIQNIAHQLNILYQNVSQQGITKTFHWMYQCRGCKRRFHEAYTECPVCGSSLKMIPSKKKPLN